MSLQQVLDRPTTKVVLSQGTVRPRFLSACAQSLYRSGDPEGLGLSLKTDNIRSTLIFYRRISRKTANCNNNDGENTNTATEKNNRIEVKTDMIIDNLPNLCSALW